MRRRIRVRKNQYVSFIFFFLNNQYGPVCTTFRKQQNYTHHIPVYEVHPHFLFLGMRPELGFQLCVNAFGEQQRLHGVSLLLDAAKTKRRVKRRISLFVAYTRWRIVSPCVFSAASVRHRCGMERHSDVIRSSAGPYGGVGRLSCRISTASAFISIRFPRNNTLTLQKSLQMCT